MTTKAFIDKRIWQLSKNRKNVSKEMIYLLGGSGYVGTAYQQFLTQKGVVFKSLRRSDLDYSNVSLLTEALKTDRPRFLINAAGYTGKPNVDACEAHKTECLFGNSVLPGRIAEACEAVQIQWGTFLQAVSSLVPVLMALA